MSDKSQIIISVDRHNDTVIKIYDDIHREDSTCSEVSLTNRQVVKIINDLSAALFVKLSAGDRL